MKKMLKKYWFSTVENIEYLIIIYSCVLLLNENSKWLTTKHLRWFTFTELFKPFTFLFLTIISIDNLKKKKNYLFYLEKLHLFNILTYSIIEKYNVRGRDCCVYMSPKKKKNRYFFKSNLTNIRKLIILPAVNLTRSFVKIVVRFGKIEMF